MSCFTTLSSVGAPLPDADIDTDVIFPARFLLLLDKAGLGRHLFHDRRFAEDGTPRRDFVLSRAPFDTARILVAGSNFGSGSSREQAVWALADFGIRCIIAPSFGEIFYLNCFKNGVLPVKLAMREHARVLDFAQSGAQITVDLQSCHIRLGTETIAFPVDASQRRALLEGLDEIGRILCDDLEDIIAFEKRQSSDAPWIGLERLDAESGKRRDGVVAAPVKSLEP